MNWLTGTILAGYGVASGRAEDCPFPGGSIRMQQPFFKSAGIDLSGYYPGTLNIDVAPYEPVPDRVIFDGKLRWFGDLEERFILSSIEFVVHDRQYSGLWYYPHPETKIDHFQPPTMVELLLPWIDRLAVGQIVKVQC